jgi:hypothetical protein
MCLANGRPGLLQKKGEDRNDNNRRGIDATLRNAEPHTTPSFHVPYQRQRFVFARSITSSARPPITAFTM